MLKYIIQCVLLFCGRFSSSILAPLQPKNMDGVVRGEEEEVFETPDIALSEDGIAMETGGPATKDGRNDNVNKVHLDVSKCLFVAQTRNVLCPV